MSVPTVPDLQTLNYSTWWPQEVQWLWSHKTLATIAWPGARSRNENRGKVLLPPWRLVYLSQLPVGDRKGEPGRLCREHWGARADGPGVRDSMTRSRSYESSPAPCTSQAQHERLEKSWYQLINSWVQVCRGGPDTSPAIPLV